MSPTVDQTAAQYTATPFPQVHVGSVAKPRQFSARIIGLGPKCFGDGLLTDGTAWTSWLVAGAAADSTVGAGSSLFRLQPDAAAPMAPIIAIERRTRSSVVVAGGVRARTRSRDKSIRSGYRSRVESASLTSKRLKRARIARNSCVHLRRGYGRRRCLAPTAPKAAPPRTRRRIRRKAVSHGRTVWPWSIFLGLGAVSCVILGTHEGTRRFELYRHGEAHEAEVVSIGFSLSGNHRPMPHAKVRVVLADGRSVEHQLRTKGTRTVGERLIAYCNSDGSDCELDAPPGGRWGTVAGALGFGLFLGAIVWILRHHHSTT